MWRFEQDMRRSELDMGCSKQDMRRSEQDMGCSDQNKRCS